MWIKQFESMTYVVMRIGHIIGLELFPMLFLDRMIYDCYVESKCVNRFILN
jgi:hypothetical protein